MSHIPKKLLALILADPFYKKCARDRSAEPFLQVSDCDGRITFEHALMYAGKQIQEKFAILPLCVWHHLGDGLDKRWNITMAMSRATEEDKKKYPRLKW